MVGMLRWVGEPQNAWTDWLIEHCEFIWRMYYFGNPGQLRSGQLENFNKTGKVYVHMLLLLAQVLSMFCLALAC